MSLRPFFTYFGGKWRAAPKYPPPIYDTIVEPFAGSAGYSLRYPGRKIILVEKSPAIAGIWRYLIAASEKEILSLPLLEPGQSVDTLAVCQEARWLIGMWVAGGDTRPRKTMTMWARNGSCEHYERQALRWGTLVQQRIASQLARIRHWEIIADDYASAPDIDATWFVDPPYVVEGHRYFGHAELDYTRLGAWCRSRRGHVMVCEQSGATWLDFQSFGAFASAKTNSGRAYSAEALWMNDWPGAALWLPARESA